MTTIPTHAEAAAKAWQIIETLPVDHLEAMRRARLALAAVNDALDALRVVDMTVVEPAHSAHGDAVGTAVEQLLGRDLTSAVLAQAARSIAGQVHEYGEGSDPGLALPELLAEVDRRIAAAPAVA